MFRWLSQLLTNIKTRKQTTEAINNLYTSNTQNRTPLDPDNDSWRT